MFASLIGWGFEVVGIVLLAIFAIWFAIRLINREAGSSIWHLFRTKVGQSGDAAKTIDPAGQMKQAAKDAAEELKDIDEAIIAAEQNRLSLQRQIDSDKTQINRLLSKIKKLDASGTPPTDPEITEKATAIKQLEKTVADNSAQVASNEKIYENLMKRANLAARKINSTIAESGALKNRLDLGAGTVKLEQMLAKYNPAAVDSKMAKIDEYRAEALKQVDGYAARTRVMAERSASFGNVEDEDQSEVNDDEVNDILARARGGNTQKPVTTGS